MFQTKVVKKIKTRVSYSVTLFENRAVYEIMWKNIVKPCRSQMTTWSILIACWIHKATNTDSEHVILIAFPLQQWLHEGSSLLHYAYIACLVLTSLVCQPLCFALSMVNAFSLAC